ncbi:3-carboxy-cis,cis-muconate cycloisomerase [Pandoraea pnomenusa]|uniref:3-carboxy-cis,cis-muconate cycloisomerase n=1 Tax=Pandoraea pnomenusa TaxID=93220 RepID=A0A378YW79_9BURK|nr:3-carboxy-cis,cis-muconate cycloisomerase [Pandoraea pnomenusa]AIU28531.1 3-carboxy-cis,cis-muconate cycloisomerase [Pandoraea pnomenusa]SUA80807.1 3-carboxy-cis,cis-muconate cycloisomerase [Pandoraea pnomenusa]
MTELLDSLLRGSAVTARFSRDATLQGMLDFEAALAAAEAETGVIPGAAVAPIAAAARAGDLDWPALRDAAARAGNLAIPLVKQLTALVAARDAEAARFVHWGATSQDAIDTGLVLQVRGALDDLGADLDGLVAQLAEQVRQHRATVMIGRTWLQHALPITFGLKLAGTLDALLRARAELAEVREQALCVQFGGAAGTLASLGGHGPAVAAALARHLGLRNAATPWHGQRDRIVRVGSWAASLTGSLGKFARDTAMLTQTEVGEIAEASGPGRGGSSTMPHKRNPVGCAAILTAAARTPQLAATLFSAMQQDHERGLGTWHAEWEALPELLMLCGGALATARTLVADWTVDTARMRENVDITRGLIMAEAVTMALGESMGRLEAHRRVEACCREAIARQRHLLDVLRDDTGIASTLSGETLERLTDPQHYLGAADTFVSRVLALADAALALNLSARKSQ